MTIYQEKVNPLQPYLTAISICRANSSNDLCFDGNVIDIKHVSTIGKSILLSNFTNIFSWFTDEGSMIIPVQKEQKSIKPAPSEKDQIVRQINTNNRKCLLAINHSAAQQQSHYGDNIS